jgi:hypothetical protein
MKRPNWVELLFLFYMDAIGILSQVWRGAGTPHTTVTVTALGKCWQSILNDISPVIIKRVTYAILVENDLCMCRG